MGKRKISDLVSEKQLKKSRHDSSTTDDGGWSQECKETERLKCSRDGWLQWGPYLSERQWGTVREDESEDGNCWDDFSHDQAAFRAYKSGEDGLMGFSDDTANLCLSVAMWNGQDKMLKERLFGLTQPQGNHAEDVKECYYYLDGTPTHSYMKALYKYPQKEYPYDEILKKGQQRKRTDPEFELLDSGIFNQGNYWDIVTEYCKASKQDILCQYAVHCRGNQEAKIWLLPTIWFRNTWSAGGSEKPVIEALDQSTLLCRHKQLGDYVFSFDNSDSDVQLIFTENETNVRRMRHTQGASSYNAENEFYKDAFHQHVMNHSLKKGVPNTVVTRRTGTKSAGVFSFTVAANSFKTIRCRLHKRDLSMGPQVFGKDFDNVINLRRQEADIFYKKIIPDNLTKEEKNIARQAYAGLCWTKQFFCFYVGKWLKDQPRCMNRDWGHMKNHDVISMPDKWEFPWYATWDLAFQMLPFAEIDPNFAKDQLLLFLSERYMHPNGQLPAYEFNFSDMNPPVHAWACLSVYKKSASSGECDYQFLKRCFQKLMLNFNWWTNVVKVQGTDLFGGGFLGMDNISCVERSHPPHGTTVLQVDGTSWVAFFALCMLQISIILSEEDPSYEDMACYFLNHYYTIAKTLMGEEGLWDEEDGFFYDQLKTQEKNEIIRVKSLVGLSPLFASTVLDIDKVDKLPKLKKFLNELISNGSHCYKQEKCYLLSVVNQKTLSTLMHHMLDEQLFLSMYGIRSLAKGQRYSMTIDECEYTVSYCPSESNSEMFGGNSNWRGPVWLCMNMLLIESLENYSQFYGMMELYNFPTGTKETVSMSRVILSLCERLVSLFLPNNSGHRPCHGLEKLYAEDPYWKDLVLFYEYFNGDNGTGCGASHQTGWTALVTCLFRKLCEARNIPTTSSASSNI